MIIEHYKNGNAEAVYRRLHEEGRMTPDGLTYVDSWVEANFERCFQVVECEDARFIQQWIVEWNDLVDFDIIPVVSSEEAARLISESKGIAADRSAEPDDEAPSAP